jgi:hypothetical protein
MKIIRIVVLLGQGIEKALPLLSFISEKIEEAKERRRQREIEEALKTQTIVSQQITDNLNQPINEK